MSDEPDKPAPGARQPSCIGVAPYYGPLPEPKKSNGSLLAQAINGMSDEPKRSWAWIGWVLLFGLILYPLSIGPANRFARSNKWSADAYRVFYSPLRILAQSSPSVARTIRSYIKWWSPTP
jgi:hypothetical protein